MFVFLITQLLKPDLQRLSRRLKRFNSAMLGLTFAFLATGCMKISGGISHFLAGPDFKKSEMIVGGTAIANGSDQLIVYVRLMNSDSSLVSDFKPDYQVTQGSAILPSQCFASDKNGLSICILKSITAGQRTIKIGNVTTINLEKQVKFLPIPLNNNQIQLVSGSVQNGNTAGPYKVRGTVGSLTSTMKQSAGPYVVFAGVQSALSAQTSQ